jgi:DNA uptake protein ComE-like DNA-binding protein
MLRMVLSVCTLVGSLAAQPLAAQTTQARADSRSAKPAVMVNLNTATSAELETLPGVGAKMAARIIEYRQKKPFQEDRRADERSGSAKRAS